MASVWQAGNWFKALAAAAATLVFNSKLIGGISSTDYPSCIGYAPFISDGDCDPDNNNSNCDYDGGDCCWCTCVPDDYSCNSFDCIDPSAYCVDDDDSGETSTTGVIIGVCTGVAALVFIVGGVVYCMCARRSPSTGKTPPAFQAGQQVGHPVQAPANIMYPPHAPRTAAYPAHAPTNTVMYQAPI